MNISSAKVVESFVSDINLASSQYDVSLCVTASSDYFRHELNIQLTYAEEAERLGEDHDMYYILMAAEKRWYEVE